MEAIIVQIIKTIQGEGPTVGTPVTLIRFGECNLKCPYCDTKWATENLKNIKPFSINFSVDTMPPYKVLNENLKDFLYCLKDQMGITERILFTGGEPFLNTELMGHIIDQFMYLGIQYEIETNGTLLGKEIGFIKKYKDHIQLNISPKYDVHKYNKDFLKITKYISEMTNVVFKFIYRQSLEEKLLKFIKNYIPENSNMVFMPLTPPLDIRDFEKKYLRSCLDTVDFCIIKDFRYSPREHVFLFGQDRNESI